MKNLLKILALVFALGASFLFFGTKDKPASVEVADLSSIKRTLVETPTYVFSPTKNINEIGWEKFPKFHLAKGLKIVYNGARYENESYPLAFDYGFTHLDRSRMSDIDLPNVPISKRAWLMTANYFEQFHTPFADHNTGHLDPFVDSNDDFIRYLSHLRGLCFNHFHDCPPDEMVATVDIFLWDLENVMYVPDKSRLAPNSPGLKIPDNEFADAYKKAMAEKYRMLTEDARQFIVKGAWVGTYNPGCVIELGNLSPDHYTNPNAKMWIWDYPAGKDGKNFKDFINFQTPGGYVTDDNLKYKNGIYMILADQEVNARWSDIPRIAVQWAFTTPPSWTPLPLKLAEAMPIFTLMSGAKGLWLWDDIYTMMPNKPNQYNLQRNFASYEAYIAGLYRLSKHNAIFEAEHKAVIPEVSFDGGNKFYQYNAAELYEKGLPIVRAIVTKDKILVAGQNPNPKNAGETKQLVVKYGKWKDIITLKNDDIYLGEAKL